jgi:opacity protein-like surface antigen
MKYYLATIVACTFLSTAVSAQEMQRSAGDKSLSFSINELSISSYKTGVGGKYWLYNDIAITGSINYSKTDSDRDVDSGGGYESSDREMETYGVTLGIEKHLASIGSVSPYYGGELRLTDGSSKQKYNNIRNKTTTKSYGVGVLLGVEYSLASNITLGAEYSLGFSKGKRNSKSGVNRLKENNESMGVSNSKLFISFYF